MREDVGCNRGSGYYRTGGPGRHSAGCSPPRVCTSHTPTTQDSELGLLGVRVRLFDLDVGSDARRAAVMATYQLHVRSYEGPIDIHEWTGDLEAMVRKFEGLPSAERRYAYLITDQGDSVRYEAIQRAEVNWP